MIKLSYQKNYFNINLFSSKVCFAKTCQRAIRNMKSKNKKHNWKKQQEKYNCLTSLIGKVDGWEKLVNVKINFVVWLFN